MTMLGKADRTNQQTSDSAPTMTVMVTGVKTADGMLSADHSHTFTIAGYPQRGNNILGKVIEPGAASFTKASDGVFYITLSYANGLGFHTGVGVMMCTQRLFKPVVLPT